MEWSARQCGRWGGKEEKGGDGGRSGQVRSGQQSRIGDLVTLVVVETLKRQHMHAVSRRSCGALETSRTTSVLGYCIHTIQSTSWRDNKMSRYHYGRSVDYHQTITPFTCHPLLLLTPIDIPISDSSLDSSLVQFNNYYAVCITYLLHFHPLLH